MLAKILAGRIMQDIADNLPGVLPILPAPDQKEAMDNATSPNAANPFLTNTNLTTHTANATAHHSNVNDPTSDQKAALPGTDGTPSSINKYVTNSDSRLSDARTPVSHNNTYHSETYITSAYDNLVSNSKIGQVANTVAAGDDSRFTDARTPIAHASTHVTSGDVIQSASNTQNGLMTSLHVSVIELMAVDVDELNTTINDGYLKRDSATQLSLNGVRTEKLFSVDISTAKTMTTSNNVLNADGSDSGSPMAASTVYWIYLSNSSPAYAPSSLRASTTMPSFNSDTNRFTLGLSGDSRYWALVGYAATNGSTEFEDNFAVATYYFPKIEAINKSGSATGPASTNNTFEDITGMSQKILLPLDWEIDIMTSVPMKADNVDTYLDLSIYDSADHQVARGQINVSSKYMCIAGGYRFIGTSYTPTYLEYKSRHSFSDVTGSSTDATKGNMAISRRPKWQI